MADSSLFLQDDPFDPSSLFDFSSDLAFDLDLDLPFDLSVDDYLLSPEISPSPPDPVSGDGSGISSASSSPDSPAEEQNVEEEQERSSVNLESKIGREKGNWDSNSSPNPSSVNLKRKNGREDENWGSNASPNPNSVGSKSIRSSDEEKTVSCGSGAMDCDERDEKKRARLMRNRESAQLSRQRRKQYVEELEDKVKAMTSTINELNLRMSYVVAENAALKQQLSGAVAPPVGFYAPLPGAVAPVHYPFVPGYGFAPQGARLLPIPKLKTQQVESNSKGKKPVGKKTGSKTKKVAGVSVLGLLLVMFLCGVLFPGFGFRYGGIGGAEDSGNGIVLSGHQEKILSITGRSDCLDSSGEVGYCSGKMDHGHNSQGSASKLNSSETLPALLYVPRDGKHVKINGNLIIHSVLASEKAMAHQKMKQSFDNGGKETSLAISGSVMSTLAVPVSGNRQLRAEEAYLNNPKTALGDVHLPQWFREGMAGPILGSGMCTEVFQFDASSPTHSNGIVPATSAMNATSIVNVSANHSPTPTQPLKIKNRRIMYGEPVLLNGTSLNDTMHFDKPSERSNLNDVKPVSSIVVSVLADPREVGDGDGNERVTPNSMSRIFVVVLLDSVKYVTYSCILPFRSSGAHLVN